MPYLGDLLALQRAGHEVAMLDEQPGLEPDETIVYQHWVHLRQQSDGQPVKASDTLAYCLLRGVNPALWHDLERGVRWLDARLRERQKEQAEDDGGATTRH